MQGTETVDGGSRARNPEYVFQEYLLSTDHRGAGPESARNCAGTSCLNSDCLMALRRPAFRHIRRAFPCDDATHHFVVIYR